MDHDASLIENHDEGETQPAKIYSDTCLSSSDSDSGEQIAKKKKCQPLSSNAEHHSESIPQNGSFHKETSFSGVPETHVPLNEENVFDQETTLVHVKHEKLQLTNFQTEVRATKDVDKFLHQCTVLLDMHETNLEKIIGQLVSNMIDNDKITIDKKTILKSLFTEDSVHCLANTIQGTEISKGGGWEESQNWMVAATELADLRHRSVGIARLRHAVNLGPTLQETQFVVLVLAPTKTKLTKNALETGKTFGTLFADPQVRQLLLDAKDKTEFKKVLQEQQISLTLSGTSVALKRGRSYSSKQVVPEVKPTKGFCGGLITDLRRRLPHYISDYQDGVIGNRAPQKLLSTTVFLYFACVLPSIAFGVLNGSNTKGKIDVPQVIVSQTIGGIAFALFAGQPLIILLTTAPLAIYIKVIYNISEDFGVDFFAFYACVGFWNTGFLILYSVTEASRLVKWSTRSTEEIFALFISLAFALSAIQSIYADFGLNYINSECTSSVTAAVANATAAPITEVCQRDVSLLYLLLATGTVWVGVTLYNFKTSPFLDESKREVLADYALPVAVLLMSFVGSYVFKAVKLHKFSYDDKPYFTFPDYSGMTTASVFASAGLGFCLSLLFFMDQNISSAMVNSPANRLIKGHAYHWDLLVVAIINGVLSAFGLPWVHGALPHSPLHVRALADVEQRVDQGHVHEIIVRVRETRLSSLLSHILIGLSLFLLPSPLRYIPKAVLDGLFLFMGVTALYGNQMFERALLLIKEQSAYPPNHYIRRVPQRKIHTFTGIQLIQLIVLCGVGFAPFPYLKMMFPLLLMVLMPIRHKLVPKFISKRYLEALDSPI